RVRRRRGWWPRRDRAGHTRQRSGRRSHRCVPRHDPNRAIWPHVAACRPKVARLLSYPVGMIGPVSQSPLTTPRAWLPTFAVLATIWGSSFLFIKVGLDGLPPVYVAAGRALSGALTLLILLAVLRQGLPRGLRVWGHLLVVGAIGVAIPFSLFAYAEQRIP